MTTPAFHSGTGRRKTAIARVRLLPGEGEIVVNGRSLEEHFGNAINEADVKMPFRVTGTEGRFNAMIKVEGGGVTGQAGRHPPRHREGAARGRPREPAGAAPGGLPHARSAHEGAQEVRVEASPQGPPVHQALVRAAHLAADRGVAPSAHSLTDTEVALARVLGRALRSTRHLRRKAIPAAQGSSPVMTKRRAASMTRTAPLRCWCPDGWRTSGRTEESALKQSGQGKTRPSVCCSCSALRRCIVRSRSAIRGRAGSATRSGVARVGSGAVSVGMGRARTTRRSPGNGGSVLSPASRSHGAGAMTVRGVSASSPVVPRDGRMSMRLRHAR